jgi:hypothetical protein
MNAKPDPNNPTTWPVADAVPTDVFLGVFTQDCTPNLTDDQKTWPAADAVPTDVFLGSITECCTPTPTTTNPLPEAAQTQPAPPART